mgnify:CR=1 FL=1
MKLIIFILIVLIIAALLIRIILRSVNQHSPLLMQLHAAGIRTGDAERILSSGEYWQRQKTLLTEREVSFMKGLFRIVDMKRWYLCPQVRVADIVQLNGNIRPRSRQWWQLFRMVSQWHVDVVIVERRSFSIVAAVELDDASHLRPERRRRDILLEEVLRQAGIPLLRSQVYRHGQNPKGHARFRCRDCHRVFQLTYTYEARKPGVKEQITVMAFNGAGIRDTARTLKVGVNTVIRTLKNSHHDE